MNKEQIDSYLFAEMSDAEREKLEDSFMGDDELFAEIVSRENELVDAYIRDELPGDERKRFERSLDSFPSRREKLSNAKMLREFIESERQDKKAITIAERSGFFSKIAEIFSFRSPAFQFASVGLILILGLLAIFLLLENSRLSSLQQELAQSRQRESELAAQVANANDASSTLADDLMTERERIRELEAEIARLGEGSGNENQRRQSNRVQMMATLVLSPVLTRDGTVPVRTLELAAGVQSIMIVVELDKALDHGAKAMLDGKALGGDASGRRSFKTSVRRSNLPAGPHKMTIVGSDGAVIVEYPFVVVELK